ncbi:expressed unknown protein [Seminavis robusta]|uniref:Uncharacterized protein n=1 Tax=Seminavis robusta TaxID=568900 RepID=A0A9N8HKY7_9STRA|nr:expressed unknown protein [Seminavis robusta]|eukprot:Sro874_g214150.1 n/a (694) ;mRNA; r:3657-5834
MHRTLALQKGGRSVTTNHGQRRILKRPPPIIEYIEKAVETGIYRTTDEIEAAMKAIRRGQQGGQGVSPPRVAMDRFRKDIIRGTQVQDYPAEYFILKQHPPIPPPPRIPKKYQKQIEHRLPKHPTERLVKKYMHRGVTHKASTEDYYRRLLGVQPPAENYAMGQKSAKLSQAYVYAVKQYEVMRTQDVSETEALKIVDELLAEDTKQEGFKSRDITEEMKDWEQHGLPLTQDDDEDGEDTSDESTSGIRNADLPSILHNKPRVVEGMLQWSHMLQNSGIPYNEWTVGASTALDHWIARNILELSEATWDALLEGSDPSLLSRGQDIVTIRETLFPETRLDETPQERDERLMMEEEADLLASTQQQEEETTETRKTESVDELLTNLRGLGDRTFKDIDMTSPASSDGPQEAFTSSSKSREKDPIQLLTEELQEWRAKNQRASYDSWPDNEKQRFSAWLDRYVGTLVSDTERRMIDMEETRISLLSSAPQTEEESDDFWSSLQDETKVDLFLHNLLQQGPPDDLSETDKVFWNLPYSEQVERLVNLGAVRPLLDEYMSDEDRQDFFRRYGDFLLDGVEMDHLVPDPNGPITGSDLDIEVVRTWGITREDRFKLVKIPYRSGLSGDEDDGESGRDAALERSRALFEAWNRHKATRARYEEALFVQGDLGLSYNSKTANEMEKDRQEEDLKELTKDD